MQTKSLKIFCDVVELRSISRAADENGISQSSASTVVQALERRLGVLLLDRSTRPFGLTPEGERFYDGCRDLVRRFEQLEEEVRTLHDAEARSLVVASIYSVGLHHMSAFMQRFSAEHPRAQVRLEYLHPHRVCEVVERGDADLGIVSYPKETEGLVALPWRSEPMVIVCHPQHRLARQAGVDLKAIDGISFVAFEPGLGIRDAIDRALAAHGAAPHVTLEFDNIETMKRAIEIDAGISILPEPTVRREIALGTLAKAAITGDALVRPLGIVHRRDRTLSELARQFIGLLKSDSDFSDEAAVLNGHPLSTTTT
ncbi:MAG TPA: LysR family transcriptional regulator [Lacipirellulaceae bacterium]|nr:LysR family transcriptional regulator [Lacipirellulaceae bacterium]